MIPTHRSISAVVCMSLCLLLGACNEAHDTVPAATTSDSAGVSIVLNSGEDRPLELHLRTIRTLGGDDAGPESFYQVARHLVAVDGQGDMVVLDRNEFRAVKFSSSGEFEFQVGREGEGPGEFKRPVGIAAQRDGSFAVLDAGRGRYVRFDAAGELVDEVPVRSFFSYFHHLDGGVVSQRLGYQQHGAVQRLLLSSSLDSVVLTVTDTARTSSYRLEGCGPAPRNVGPEIFGPELVWHGNWGAIALNGGPLYAIDIMDASGRLVRSVRRDTPVEIATLALATQWAEENPTRYMSSAGECVIDPQQVAEKRGFATYVPLVGAVRLAPDGSLWVQRSAFVADSGKIDLFDPSGQYLGTLPSDSRLPIGFTPSGEVLFVERDELDVERLVVAEILSGREGIRLGG